jgi:hypothetical protein
MLKVRERARRIACVSLLCCFVLVSVGPEPAEADTPLVAILLVDIAVGVASAWLYDAITSDGDKVCVTTETCVETTSSGSIIAPTISEAVTTRAAAAAVTQKVCVTNTTYASSSEIATVVVPDDLDGLPIPAGHNLSEVISFAAPPAGPTITFGDLGYDADVLLTSLPIVGFETEREVEFRFIRDPAVEAEESTFVLPIDIDGALLSTTPVEGTTAAVAFDLSIETLELGPLFSGQIHVAQGEAPVVLGDIPTSEIFVNSGVAFMPQFSDDLILTVPPEVDTLSFRLRFRTSGVGQEQLAFEIPALNATALGVLAILLASAGWISLRRTKRRRNADQSW